MTVGIFLNHEHQDSSLVLPDPAVICGNCGNLLTSTTKHFISKMSILPGLWIQAVLPVTLQSKGQKCEALTAFVFAFLKD